MKAYLNALPTIKEASGVAFFSDKFLVLHEIHSCSIQAVSHYSMQFAFGYAN